VTSLLEGRPPFDFQHSEIFSSPQPEEPLAKPSLTTNEYLDHHYRRKSGQSVTFNTHIHLVSRLRMRRALPHSSILLKRVLQKIECSKKFKIGEKKLKVLVKRDDSLLKFEPNAF
jgi:hypothetical protein